MKAAQMSARRAKYQQSAGGVLRVPTAKEEK
jgi:hypothetical protein